MTLELKDMIIDKKYLVERKTVSIDGLLNPEKEGDIIENFST